MINLNEKRKLLFSLKELNTKNEKHENPSRLTNKFLCYSYFVFSSFKYYKTELKRSPFCIANFTRPLFLIILLFIAGSCDNPAIYDLFQPVENAVWAKNKTFYFTFEIKDNNVPYNVALELRNNSLYPYKNLWIVCKEEQSIDPLLKDTIECVLADESGKWKGKGFSLFANSFPLKENFYFPRAGLYTFSFSHAMTDEQLKGIHEIGLSIVKSQTTSVASYLKEQSVQ